MSIPAIKLQQSVKQPPDNEAVASSGSLRKSATTQFTLNSPSSDQRARLEQFIANKFNIAYGASIVEFFPLLLSRTDDRQLSSVVGLRPGTERPLFLEQYLDRPLEEAISRQSGVQVERARLMEIGNLASSYRSGNQLMFILLTAVLARAGYTWVVFTATSQVRSLLTRLEFHPVTLCEADESRLVNKQQVWGSYYQSQPMVQAGSVSQGMAVLESNEFSRKLLQTFDTEIDCLAETLRILRQQRRGQ